VKVTQEVVTILADPQAGEINIVLAGFRIVLSIEEGAALAQGLAPALERLLGGASSAAAEPWAVRRAPAPETAADTADAEAIQARARALIRATMRAKGLSLGEELKE
jgi:hypothetical protein